VYCGIQKQSIHVRRLDRVFVLILSIFSTILTVKVSFINTVMQNIFKTVLSSGYILILLSIEYILASLIEMCQGQSRMRNVK